MSSLPIRTAGEIAQSEVEYVSGAATQVTDLSIGSVIRTILEAFAIEQNHLEVAVALASNDAIEQSSYTTFGFTRAPATAATGAVTFVLNTSSAGTVTIPKGTQVRVPGVNLKVYQTTQATSVVLTGGPGDPTEITAPVTCTVAGASGNTPAGTITQIVTAVSGIASVTNLQALFNGTDLETDAERRARFAQFIRTLQRATKDAILAGALSTTIFDDFGYVTDMVRKAATVENTPGVANAATTPADPTNPPPGTVWVFVHNGVSTPSAALVAAAQQVIDGWEDTTQSPSVIYPGWKAAGIQAQVFPAIEVEIPVSLTYDIDNGYLPAQVVPAITQTITSFFDQIDIASPFYVEQFKRKVAATPGVLDFQLLTPTTNVTTAYNQLVRPGSLTIEENPPQ